MRHTWSEWSLITATVKCRACLSSGDPSLSGACTLVSSWVQEGCVEGLLRRQSRELPDPQSGFRMHPWRRRQAWMRAGESPQAPWAREEAAEEKPLPLTPRTACGRRTPPLTWTLPSRTLPLLHKPRSTTRTPDPLFYVGYLFSPHPLCLSFAPPATPCWIKVLISLKPYFLQTFERCYVWHTI